MQSNLNSITSTEVNNENRYPAPDWESQTHNQCTQLYQLIALSLNLDPNIFLQKEPLLRHKPELLQEFQRRVLTIADTDPIWRVAKITMPSHWASDPGWLTWKASDLVSDIRTVLSIAQDNKWDVPKEFLELNNQKTENTKVQGKIFSQAVMKREYHDRINEFTQRGISSSRAEDDQWAHTKGYSTTSVRDLRREFAPASWTAKGRPKKVTK